MVENRHDMFGEAWQPIRQHVVVDQRNSQSTFIAGRVEIDLRLKGQQVVRDSELVEEVSGLGPQSV